MGVLLSVEDRSVDAADGLLMMARLFSRRITRRSLMPTVRGQLIDNLIVLVILVGKADSGYVKVLG